MCKNNLGCVGNQNCGCGCPSCGKKRDTKKISDNPILIQAATFEPSGYGKKQKLIVAFPSGSGYSKKNIIPTANSETISPMVEIIPNKNDDSGLVIAGTSLLIMIIIASHYE